MFAGAWHAARAIEGARTNAVHYQRGVLNDTADCLMGMCPERTERDKATLGAVAGSKCVTCGLYKNDWNTHDPDYVPWDTKCPSCKRGEQNVPAPADHVVG